MANNKQMFSAPVKVKEYVAAGSFGEVPLVADVAEEGAQDWLTILRLRTTELRPGGRMVVVHPGQSKGIAWLFRTLDRCAAFSSAQKVAFSHLTPVPVN
jgi:hypothetical protein